MATMNISIPDPMKAWVQAQVDSGLYSNASDYLRDLIRRDHERRDKMRALQEAITEGLESGVAEEFALNDFLKNMRRKHLNEKD